MQDYKDTYLENQVLQIARLQAEGKFIAADEQLTGFGLLAGRPSSDWIICPTTALALLFMALATPQKRRSLYLVTMGLLLLWAIPFPILIQIPQFGAYEDGIMVVLGVYALVGLLLRGRGAKSSL
jgi:hypothetical protein